MISALERPLLFLLAACALLLIAPLMASVEPTIHALQNHAADEVIAIRTCFNKNGDFMVFKSLTDPNRWYRTCQLPDGRIGLQVVVEQMEECVEATCFVPKDGSWARVRAYLERFSTRWKGAVPWD